MKLYLDADVVIGGDKRPQHASLRELAIQGSVELYWSPTGQHEQSARSITAHKMPLPDDQASARTQLDARDALHTGEEAERDWWRPARLQYPHCTFEGLIVTVLIADLLGDPTGELALFTDLLDNNHVKSKDAIHLMIAHSASLDRVLTWDARLIKKAARVTWLAPEVETPESFLASWAA